MIETRRLKNDVIFVQTILSFVLSRKISKLSDEHNTRGSILAQSSPSNESVIDVGTFL